MDQLATRYPISVIANFRKTNRETLTKILKHYGVQTPSHVNQAELAVFTARVFENQTVNENEVVDKFASIFCRNAEPSLKKERITNTIRLQLDAEPAKIGEQVAAKVLKSNQNGSWILGCIIDYNPHTRMYEVQDEDDTSRVMLLNYHDVRRLEDSAAHLRRGDHVLAVFPETTSFYRSILAKTPKTPTHGNGLWEAIVRFEDDEDESGKAPPRRVPARFILKRSYVELDFVDDNDEDR